MVEVITLCPHPSILQAKPKRILPNYNIQSTHIFYLHNCIKSGRHSLSPTQYSHVSTYCVLPLQPKPKRNFSNCNRVMTHIFYLHIVLQVEDTKFLTLPLANPTLNIQ